VEPGSDCLKPEERLAAEVLASRLGGTIDPKDVCGAQATHDGTRAV
jgi:hypothetical protein